MKAQNIGMTIEINDDLAKEYLEEIYSAFQEAGRDMPKHLNDALCSLQIQVDEQTSTPQVLDGRFVSTWEHGNVDTAGTIDLDDMSVTAEQTDGLEDLGFLEYEELMAENGVNYPVCVDCHEYAYKDKVCPGCGSEQEPRAYRVDVSRIGYGNTIITVEAHSQEEANELAIEEAGDHDFSEHSSEYQVN